MKKILIMLLVIFSMTSITTSGSLESDDLMLKELDEPCCLNGYKTWKEPSWIWGQGVNFVDCQCTLQKGRDPVQCECSIDQ